MTTIEVRLIEQLKPSATEQAVAAQVQATRQERRSRQDG